jgi:hypothetical protein
MKEKIETFYEIISFFRPFFMELLIIFFVTWKLFGRWRDREDGVDVCRRGAFAVH